MCDVPPGDYRVINLTLDRRYSNVPVWSDNELAMRVQFGDLDITGNLIGWPDHADYIVTDTRHDLFKTGEEGIYSYITVCDSQAYFQAPPCELHDSTFLAQEQASGNYTNLAVKDSIVAIENNFILPRDGWYQVQYALTYESICEGSLTCNVETPGTFNIINLSTGVRVENFSIDYTTGEPAMPERLTRFAALMEQANYPDTLQTEDFTLFVQLVDDASENFTAGSDTRYVPLPGYVLMSDRSADMTNTSIRQGPFDGDTHENLCWFELFGLRMDGSAYFRTFGPDGRNCERLLRLANEALEAAVR